MGTLPSHLCRPLVATARVSTNQCLIHSRQSQHHCHHTGETSGVNGQSENVITGCKVKWEICNTLTYVYVQGRGFGVGVDRVDGGKGGRPANRLI